MIQVKADIQVVFIKGAHKMRDIRAAVAKATGRKRPPMSDWIVVGLADDTSTGLQTALPYSPADDREPIGFLRERRET